MEPNQVNQQDSKQANQKRIRPYSNHRTEIRLPLILGPEQNHANNIDGKVEQSDQSHGQEVVVIFLANAIVNPHAMMIKFLNAPEYKKRYLRNNHEWVPLAHFAMSRCFIHITRTNVAVQTVIDVHVPSRFVKDNTLRLDCYGTRS